MLLQESMENCMYFAIAKSKAINNLNLYVIGFFVKEFKDFNCKDLQTQIKAVKAVLKSINIKELYATNESFLGYVRRDIENKNRAVAVLCDYEMAVCNLDFIFDSGFLTEFSKIEKLPKSCAYTILLPQEITECITIGN